MINSLIKKINRLPRYVFDNIIYPKILNLKYHKTLAKNKELKNSHQGERCFILGNGPSIKDINLLTLQKEKLFVVNNFIKHPDFDQLKPANYILADRGFFNSTNENDFYGQDLKEKSQRISSQTKIFLNIIGKDLVDRRQLFANHNVYYLAIQGLFSTNFPFNIKIDKTIPFPKNVIVAALIIAVYLGFEKIYLLGCEHDYLSYHYRPDKLNDPKHIYNFKEFYSSSGQLDHHLDDKIIKEQALERVIYSNYETELGHIKQLFKNYRLFYQKVKRINPKIEIYNATPNSFLDVFPFVDFKDIKLN